MPKYLIEATKRLVFVVEADSAEIAETNMEEYMRRYQDDASWDVGPAAETDPASEPDLTIDSSEGY